MIEKRAILISCFDWYDMRLCHIKNVMEEEGYNVKILTSDFNHIKKEYFCEIKNDIELIHVPSYKKNLSIKRIYSHYYFSKCVKNKIEIFKPSIIYALLPPNFISNICTEYRKRHSDIKLIYDIIDLWPESMPIEKIINTYPIYYWKNLRNSNLCYADFVFTECKYYQDILIQYLPEKSTHLYLCKDMSKKNQRQIIDNIKEYKYYRNFINFAYLGSINNILDISKICKIISLLKSINIRVCLKIIGDGEKREDLIMLAKESGAEIEYYGKVFDETKKIEILSNCDFGLNIMKKSVCVGLTTKSIDYFSYGLPLINNIPGDTWNYIEMEGVGINYINSIDFLNKISDWNIDKHNIIKFYNNNFSKEIFERKIRNSIL